MTWDKDATENFGDWREIGTTKNEKTRETTRREKRKKGRRTVKLFLHRTHFFPACGSFKPISNHLNKKMI